MRKALIAMVIVGSLLIVNAGLARADGAKSGLYVGADLVFNVPEQDLQGDFADVDPGAGFDVKLGYRFSIPLAIEVEWGGTGHKVGDVDAGIGFLVIDLRYFPFVFSDRPLYPYVRVGVGGYALVIDNLRDPSGRRDDLKLTGGGVDVGVGFDYFLTPEVTLGVEITQRFVKYDDLDYLDAKLVEDVKGAMTSLNGGLQYHF
ncbi:MAG: hypothetical protein EPO39_15250 [Candidatus Manganitrophaceae bacterium]|nr:MAG: hypothetical protein EPO39_15250 [Candidatus Manganitrophaceae bacterium]